MQGTVELHQGKLIALLGPDGEGKSTLLQLLGKPHQGLNRGINRELMGFNRILIG